MTNMIASAMSDDDHVLWSAKPLPLQYGWYGGKWYFLAGAALIFGAIIAGFAAYDQITDAFVQTSKTLAAIVGLGLVAVAAGYAWSADRTHYALTTSHIFRSTGFWRQRLDGAALADISSFEMRPGPFGSAHVIFKIRSEDTVGNGAGRSRSLRFIAVDDAEEVNRVLGYELTRVRSIDSQSGRGLGRDHLQSV